MSWYEWILHWWSSVRFFGKFKQTFYFFFIFYRTPHKNSFVMVNLWDVYVCLCVLFLWGSSFLSAHPLRLVSFCSISFGGIRLSPRLSRNTLSFECVRKHISPLQVSSTLTLTLRGICLSSILTPPFHLLSPLPSAVFLVGAPRADRQTKSQPYNCES